MKIKIFIALVLLFCFSNNGKAIAQTVWQADGVPVCTATGDQMNPVLVPDHKGGGIIIWQDYRAGNWDLYAQRVDSSGNRLWTGNGVAVAASAEMENEPKAVSDLRGGAIMVFNKGSYNVWAQRVDSLGNACWGANGLDVSSLSNTQYLQMSYQIISDSSGGAYITWDNRDTLAKATNDDIYAQLIDSSGNYVWNTAGVVVAGGSATQGTPYIVASKNSAIITWLEGPWLNQKFYAQRINNVGNLLWPLPAPVCTSSNVEKYIQGITPDSRGGGIIVWKDERSGRWDVYAQRVDSSGNVLWQINGVPICTAIYDQQEPVITSDGCGGGIIIWHDQRTVTTTHLQIYAQRLDSTGNILWMNDGVLVCDDDSLQCYPCITMTDSGKIVISWFDTRTGQYDIYAQAMNGDGSLGWSTSGLAVCTAANVQFNDIYNRQNQIITSDNKGGVILTWHDTRSGNYDIYAQKIGGLTGVEGRPEGSIEIKTLNLKVWPNPFRGQARISGIKLNTMIKVYDITGRLVERTTDGLIGKKLSVGVYFVTVENYKAVKAIKIK